MHAVGIVGLLAWCLGRRRRGGPPARPVLFWSVAAIATLPLVAVIPFLPAAFLLHTSGVRLLGAVAAGLLAASTVVAVLPSRTVG